KKRAPKGRIWLWFAAGFATAFLGLGVLCPVYFYDGGAVVLTRLWHYYLLNIQQVMNSTGNLGPTSGNAAAALTTAAMHLGLCAAAGAIMMAFGWIFQKWSSRA